MKLPSLNGGAARVGSVSRWREGIGPSGCAADCYRLYQECLDETCKDQGEYCKKCCDDTYDSCLTYCGDNGVPYPDTTWECPPHSSAATKKR